MRSGLSQAQEQALMRSAADIMPPPAVAPTTKEIPYDYVAKFKLQGKAGNRVQDVINISVEGGFVAVAIGYSFIPAKLPAPPASPAGLTVLIARPPNTTVEWLLANIIEPIVNPLALMQCLVVHFCGIDFKYSIVDSGTGRELQNQPIHNIAGLGEATGDRPFRPLAKPMLFMPRSTIRIEVEEVSEGPIYGYEDQVTKQRVGAELFIVLHGYKVLGYGTALP
ncbi:MAG: hypothetical protein ACT4P5_00420 [Armatimonadota bacterium]